MTQPPTPQPGQPFDPNQIPTDPQQAAAWAQQQQAAAWQQHAAWQQQAAQQAAQEAQEEAHQEYLEQQAAAAKGPAFGGVRGIISLVVGLVVVGASAFGAWTYFQKSQDLKQGNCMVFEAKGKDETEAKKVECGSNDLSWKINQVTVDDDLCSEDSLGYYELSGRKRRGGTEKKVACLVPMFKEGKCYNVSDSNKLEDVKVAECTTGNIRVNKVIPEKEAVCEVPEQTSNHPSVDITYCIEEVA